MYGFRSTHYALSLKIDMLMEHCQRMVPTIRNVVGPYRPVFCFSGFSGSGTATALATEYYRQCGPTFGMIYVRKSGEGCHGNPQYECSLNNVEKHRFTLVFVDDTVSSGETRRRVIHGAKSCIRQEAGMYTGIESLMDKDRLIQVLDGGVDVLSLKDDGWTRLQPPGYGMMGMSPSEAFRVPSMSEFLMNPGERVLPIGDPWSPLSKSENPFDNITITMEK